MEATIKFKYEGRQVSIPYGVVAISKDKPVITIDLSSIPTGMSLSQVLEILETKGIILKQTHETLG